MHHGFFELPMSSPSLKGYYQDYVLRKKNMLIEPYHLVPFLLVPFTIDTMKNMYVYMHSSVGDLTKPNGF